jgi:mannosyltransferase OCH1-like enzyme
MKNLSASYNIFKSYFKDFKDLSFRIENYSSSLTPTYTQAIPFRIIQTSWSREIDFSHYQCVQINRNVNPEYEYLFFDDKECIEFIKEHFPDYLQWYNKLIPGAYKADLFRLLALKKLGGVYLDLKTTCIEPLRTIIRPNDEFVSIKDNYLGSVYNGMIGSIPDHPILNDAIQRSIDNIKNESVGINPFDIGGPQTLGRAYNTYLGREEMAEIDDQQHSTARMVGDVWNSLKSSPITAVSFSLDRKRALFNRTCPSYVKSKLKQLVKGKEYHSLWVFGKVFNR